MIDQFAEASAGHATLLRFILNGVLIAALVYVVIDDLRNYRIRNRVVAVLFALSLVLLISNGDLHAVIVTLVFAVLAALLLLLAYSRDMVGGGDVKLLSVALLGVGPQAALPFAIALFGLVLLYWAGARLGLLPFRRVDGRMQVPFGPGIAGAWIATILASGAA